MWNNSDGYRNQIWHVITIICSYCSKTLERFLQLDLPNTQLQCVRERGKPENCYLMCAVWWHFAKTGLEAIHNRVQSCGWRRDYAFSFNLSEISYGHFQHRLGLTLYVGILMFHLGNLLGRRQRKLFTFRMQWGFLFFVF